VQRILDSTYYTELKIVEKKKRGGPKPRWIDTIADKLKHWGFKREGAEDWERWWMLIEIESIKTGHPYRTTTV